MAHTGGRRATTLVVALAWLGATACHDMLVVEDQSAGGAGGDATTSTGGVGAGGAASTSDGSGGCNDCLTCPEELPGQGTFCGDSPSTLGTVCEYDDPCATRAVCREDISYLEETVWIHLPPEEGTPCPAPGKLCIFSYYEGDNIDTEAAALCTQEGWWVHSVWCETGFDCGHCPAEAPEAGASCDDTFEYPNCVYATETSCGYRGVTIACEEGSWAVTVEPCP